MSSLTAVTTRKRLDGLTRSFHLALIPAEVFESHILLVLYAVGFSVRNLLRASLAPTIDCMVKRVGSEVSVTVCALTLHGAAILLVEGLPYVHALTVKAREEWLWVDRRHFDD